MAVKLTNMQEEHSLLQWLSTRAILSNGRLEKFLIGKHNKTICRPTEVSVLPVRCNISLHDDVQDGIFYRSRDFLFSPLVNAVLPLRFSPAGPCWLPGAA